MKQVKEKPPGGKNRGKGRGLMRRLAVWALDTTALFPSHLHPKTNGGLVRCLALVFKLLNFFELKLHRPGVSKSGTR
jgi:hypothetical protein